jgi:hypothetical protein
MKTEKIIPNDKFELRLHHNLNKEYQKLNALLVEQVQLLKSREALMSKIHAAVEQRWKDEEEAASVVVRPALTEEEAQHE